MDKADSEAVKEVKEMPGRQAVDTKKRADEQSYIYALEVTKDIEGTDIAVFGGFTDNSSGSAWTITVSDADEGTPKAAASKDNIKVDSATGAFFAFENDKGVLNDMTNVVDKIVAQDKDKNTLEGNLKKGEITFAKDGTTKTQLNVVIDSTAKRATVGEVYNVTFLINGVPCVVPVTFEGHELTEGEASAAVEAVSGDAKSVTNYTDNDTADDRGATSPIRMTASGTGYNITLTAAAYTATDKDKELLDSWYKGNTDNGAVVALSFKCPEGALGVKVGEKTIDLSNEVDGAIDGYLTIVVKITEEDMGKAEKTVTLTWCSTAECEEGSEMGESAVTYTLDLTDVTWGGTPAAVEGDS